MQFSYISALFYLLFICLCGYGQGNFITSSSSSITVSNNTTLYVQGNVQMEENSLFNNSGDIRLTKNWINNSLNNGFDPSFTLGNVHFIGGNQLIDGIIETHFHNVYLYGDYTIKECLINSVILGRLHLNNSELQTHQNIVTVTNPNSNSITFDRGYVASDLLGGYLIRKTNSTDSYYFPTGNSLIDFFKRLRPVTLTPTNNSENYFAVRLAPLFVNDDFGISITGATAPFSTTQKQPELKDFNPLYYHNIARTQGNTLANVDIWYEKEDGDYTTVAQWNDQEQWIDQKFEMQNFSSPTVYNFPLSKAYQQNFNLINHDAYILANTTNINNIYVPNSFSPNGDGENEVFIPIITIEDIDQYELTIYDRWGHQLFFTDDLNKGWNGTSQSKETQIGTYIWSLKLKSSESSTKFIEKMGHVNLIR